MSAELKTRRFPWLLIAFVVPALAALLALGTWQVQRLAWKEDLLATINARIAAEPMELADVMAATGGFETVPEYQPVRVTGVFDHDHEQHFFATHKGISGYYVYTPMLTDGGAGKALFINRGFVPFDFKARETRPESLVEGPVAVEGLLRAPLAKKPSFIVPENDPAANIYYWKDLAAMISASGLTPEGVLPVFVDAGLPSKNYPLGEWPVAGVTIIDLPNSHLQYAITWYGLALVLVVVAAVFIRRRLKP